MSSPSKTRGRLAGHALRNEGAPFVMTETQRWERVGMYGGVGGVGRAMCSCGAHSDLLDTGGARRRWHREHKERVSRGLTDECQKCTQEETP